MWQTVQGFLLPKFLESRMNECSLLSLPFPSLSLFVLSLLSPRGHRDARVPLYSLGTGGYRPPPTQSCWILWAMPAREPGVVGSSGLGATLLHGAFGLYGSRAAMSPCQINWGSEGCVPASTDSPSSLSLFWATFAVCASLVTHVTLHFHTLELTPSISLLVLMIFVLWVV